MKLNEVIVASEYEDLLSFNSTQDEDKHNATMIMFKFLSAIDDATKDKISRKNLASLIGTSPSYITQLFRGDKLINLITVAKFERVLDMEFDIIARFNSETKTEIQSYENILYFPLTNPQILQNILSEPWLYTTTTNPYEISNNIHINLSAA